MNEVPKPRWGCLQWTMVVVIPGCLLMLVMNVFLGVRRAGEQMKVENHCMQIILALGQYSKQQGAVYPDGRHPEFKSANQLFRELIKEGVVSSEAIFGCPGGSFNPNDDIGNPPNYESALVPGECHWMLLRHQSSASHGKTPIVIENSLSATWPPRWDVSFWTGNKRGRAWAGEVIMVGRNDGSVSLEKLRPDGTLDWHSPPNLDEHGKSWIDYLTPEQVAKLSYWDIEDK
jgi:hypothetical protein